MSNEKIVNSLIKHLLKHNMKLANYRNFLTLSHGGIIQTCPETNSPCNSSCVFFNLYVTVSGFRVVLSCKSVSQQFNVENNEKN